MTNLVGFRMLDVRIHSAHLRVVFAILLCVVVSFQGLTVETLSNLSQHNHHYFDKALNAQTYSPLDYSVIIIHYHKTGYAISNILLDKIHAVGEDIGFRGNRQQPERRRHNLLTKCPNFYLETGMVSIQRAPNLFCSTEDLERILSPKPQNQLSLNFTETKTSIYGTKIIHLIRNPFEMAVSNYLYHSQFPTPEPWVKKEYNPCDENYYHRYNDTSTSNETLVDLLFPTLTMISRSQIDDVRLLCRSLFGNPDIDRGHGRHRDSFYGHLRHLEPFDALRLSTSSQIIGGGGNLGYPAGDILRMANNILKLSQLMRNKSDFRRRKSFIDYQLLTMGMSQWTQDPASSMAEVLDFVFGDRISQEKKQVVAAQYGKDYEITASEKSNSHITSNKDFHHDQKEELKGMLRNDLVLGPILIAVEEIIGMNI